MAQVLIIDDDWQNRQAISFALRVKGHEILEADSGSQALQLLETHRPDIILLDIMMPDMNGFDVFQRLRADDRTKDIPVLAVSGRALQWDVEQARQVGLTEYLVKPFDPEELLERIQAMLA